MQKLGKKYYQSRLYSIEDKSSNEYKLLERFIDVTKVILNRFQAYLLLYKQNYFN